MRKSVLLQRVFVVVAAALLLTALLTTLIYTTVSRSTFAGIKSAEMLPKARALSKLANALSRRDMDADAFSDMLSRMGADGAALIGAYAVITDAGGEALLTSPALGDSQYDAVRPMIQRVLAGEEVVATGALRLGYLDVIGVGVPIRDGEAVTGAALLFTPMYEALAAMSSLNSALLAALLAVMPLVFGLLYIAVGRLVRPLRSMRDIAMQMASGHFDARADDTQRGEIGQMGFSLNHLSRELSHTIAELTLSRNRLKQSVDGLAEGFVSLDAQARITYSNPALFRMFGEPEGSGRASLVPDEETWREFDRVIAGNQPAERDILWRDRTIRATITPIVGDDGANAGAVGLFHDVTESERLERTRREYVANVSHELRRPLTAMRGLIEPLRDGMVTSEDARKRYYDIILRETLRLSRLIDDLMELSRLQSGRTECALSPMSLAPVIEDVAEKYAASAAESGLRFTLAFDPEACPPVMSNADRLEQVLVILLDNAIKYSNPGGEVALEAAWDEKRVTLTVRDTGVGIAGEDLPYVFDRFYKADRAHTGSGSGLGLSIAREVLERMGETIGVKSEIGKGSAFSFTVRRNGEMSVAK